MTINKNIMKKIMNKVVLNRWKKRVKNINGEYHHYYEWTSRWDNEDINVNNGQLSLNRKNYPECCICMERYESGNISYKYYNIFGTKTFKYVYNRKITYCKRCKKYHPSLNNRIVSDLPEKYEYTSGMDDPNGYKKIE